MILTLNEKSIGVVDEVYDADAFLKLHNHFNLLDYSHNFINGWIKVWRLNDGYIVGSNPVEKKDMPSNTAFDWIDSTVSYLAKNYFEDVVGKEGEDWTNIVYRSYIYPTGSKISWHDDVGYSGACIFYWHQEWSPFWGGELLVAKTPPAEESEKIVHQNPLSASDHVNRSFVNGILNKYGMGSYFTPLPNRMIFTSGSLWHSINRVDQAAGDKNRCSVVCFFKK